MKQMKDEQERVDNEALKKASEQIISAAGQMMVALGIDLSDNQHKPGVEQVCLLPHKRVLTQGLWCWDGPCRVASACVSLAASESDKTNSLSLCLHSFTC